MNPQTSVSSVPSAPLAASVSPGSLQNLTLFCDFDGPIVDVSDRYYNTYQLALADVQTIYRTGGVTLPLHNLSKGQFWQMKQERTPDTEIAMRSGLQGQQIDLFLKRVNQIVNNPTLLHQDQLQPGVRWALTLLHAQGAQLVLVTLRCQQQATQLLHEHGLLALFSRIWGAQDDHAAYRNQANHKTQLLTEAIADCGLSSSDRSPANAWMIGDTEADIIAGQTTGIPTMALTCGIRSQTYLHKFQPTRMHSDLLSAAHYLLVREGDCFADPKGDRLNETLKILAS